MADPKVLPVIAITGYRCLGCNAEPFATYAEALAHFESHLVNPMIPLAGQVFYWQHAKYIFLNAEVVQGKYPQFYFLEQADILPFTRGWRLKHIDYLSFWRDAADGLEVVAFLQAHDITLPPTIPIAGQGEMRPTGRYFRERLSVHSYFEYFEYQLGGYAFWVINKL